MIILPGDRRKTMERLVETMGLRPGVSVIDHYCSVTAEPRRPAFGSSAGSGFHLFITLGTVAEQQRLLADYNVVETVSAPTRTRLLLRVVLPGAGPARRARTRAWQSEEHLDAARERPEFIRHMSYLSAAARTSWTGSRSNRQ